MRWAIGSVVLLILPLSLVTIALFYCHVTRPTKYAGTGVSAVKKAASEAGEIGRSPQPGI